MCCDGRQKKEAVEALGDGSRSISLAIWLGVKPLRSGRGLGNFPSEKKLFFEGKSEKPKLHSRRKSYRGRLIIPSTAASDSNLDNSFPSPWLIFFSKKLNWIFIASMFSFLCHLAFIVNVSESHPVSELFAARCDIFMCLLINSKSNGEGGKAIFYH